jgi:hypothetical protein
MLRVQLGVGRQDSDDPADGDGDTGLSIGLLALPRLAHNRGPPAGRALIQGVALRSRGVRHLRAAIRPRWRSPVARRG